MPPYDRLHVLRNAGLGITLGCDSWPSLAALNTAIYHFIDQGRNLHHLPLNLEALLPPNVVEAYNALLLGEESMTKFFQKQTPVVTTPASATITTTAEPANKLSKAARSPRVKKPGITVLDVYAVKNRKARERKEGLGRTTAINGLPENVKALLSKEQIDQLLHG